MSLYNIPILTTSDKNRPKPMKAVYNTSHEAFPLLCC